MVVLSLIGRFLGLTFFARVLLGQDGFLEEWVWGFGVFVWALLSSAGKKIFYGHKGTELPGPYNIQNDKRNETKDHKGITRQVLSGYLFKRRTRAYLEMDTVT